MKLQWIILAVLIFLIGLNTKAQTPAIGDDRIFPAGSEQTVIQKSLKYKLVKKMKESSLLVELLEVNPAIVKKFNDRINRIKDADKKAEQEAELEAYHMFINNYNEYIKAAITENWKQSSSIDYKTTSEVLDMKKSQKNGVIILRLSEVTKAGMAKFRYKHAKDLGILYLGIDELKRGRSNPSYTFPIPATTCNDRRLLTEADLALSIRMINAQIEAQDEKKYRNLNFNQYGLSMKRDSAEKILKEPVYLPSHLIFRKTNISEINDEYDHNTVIEISGDELEQMILSKNDNVIACSIPYKMLVSKDRLNEVGVSYIRCLVNASNGEIYYCRGAKGGNFKDQFYRAAEFKYIGEGKKIK